MDWKGFKLKSLLIALSAINVLCFSVYGASIALDRLWLGVLYACVGILNMYFLSRVIIDYLKYFGDKNGYC